MEWYGDLEAAERLKNDSLCIIKNGKIRNVKENEFINEYSVVHVHNFPTIEGENNEYIEKGRMVRYKFFKKRDVNKDVEDKGMKIEPINLYQKETVEHLVDQLIKLQDTYTTTHLRNNYVDKKQIYEAMERINKALDGVLNPRLTLK